MRLAIIFAIALGLEAVAWFVVGGFASIVLVMVGLAVFWIGLKHYVVPKQRSD